jgi:hypothetical protein
VPCEDSVSRDGKILNEKLPYIDAISAKDRTTKLKPMKFQM